MSSQHNRDKQAIRTDAETVAGLLIDAGLVTLGEELRDLLRAANHCEIALKKHRTSEAFYLSAEAHRTLNVRTDKARKTIFETRAGTQTHERKCSRTLAINMNNARGGFVVLRGDGELILTEADILEMLSDEFREHLRSGLRVLRKSKQIETEELRVA